MKLFNKLVTAFSGKKRRVSPDMPSSPIKSKIPSQQTPSKRFSKSLSEEAKKSQNTKRLDIREASLNERLDEFRKPSGLINTQREQDFKQRFKDLDSSWQLLKSKPKPLSKDFQNTIPLLEKLYQSQIKANKIDHDLIDVLDT
ncbi:MAG: hypothetical protein ACJARD_001192 [Alphaproteobacteria bacterium]|jgi:hypothetical protein